MNIDEKEAKLKEMKDEYEKLANKIFLSSSKQRQKINKRMWYLRKKAGELNNGVKEA